RRRRCRRQTASGRPRRRALAIPLISIQRLLPPIRLRDVPRPRQPNLLAHLARNLGEKRRRRLLAKTPVQSPLERVEAVELLARPRHADVAEPPLLFDVVRLVARVR